MKITIYTSNLGAARIIFDTDTNELTLVSEVIGTKSASKPDDNLGGGYTGREIVDGWLKGSWDMTTAGEWVHDSDEDRENNNRLTLIKWLEGVECS